MAKAKMATHSESSLFTPVSKKKMQDQYPELSKIKAFSKLHAGELEFCWFMGIHFLDVENIRDRAQMSLAASNYRSKLSDIDLEHWISGNYPDRIKKAIEKFSSFDLNTRAAARLIAYATLSNYKKLSAVDAKEIGIIVIYGEDSEGRTTDEVVGHRRDWNQVQAYVNTMTKMNKDMGDLIRLVEEGHGFNVEAEVELNTASIRESFQAEQREKNK